MSTPVVVNNINQPVPNLLVANIKGPAGVPLINTAVVPPTPLPGVAGTGAFGYPI